MNLPQRDPNLTPIGLCALLEMVGNPVPLPSVQYYAGTSRKDEAHAGGARLVIIARRTAPQTTQQHLEYALRHEAVDLRAWSAILRALDSKILEDWVRAQPTGRGARRAWYLYELLTSKRLALSDAAPLSFARLGDARLQYLGSEIKSLRHRVIDNLLGDQEFCPMVRVTKKLEEYAKSDLKQKAVHLVASIHPDALQRATDYLFHQETKASFQIEREDASKSRMERFVNALKGVEDIRWYDEDELAALQKIIVDPRYAEGGFRKIQTYVGQTLPSGQERVSFPCAKSEDVSSLMSGWRKCLYRTSKTLNPVCQAAVLGFGFVFIHPFEDGNGRLHRFVIHATLVRRSFTPPGVTIPVSATMLKQLPRYNASLEAFSKPLLKFIDFTLDEHGAMTVHNDTAHLYRFWDATEQCEYLYETISETINSELVEELRTLRAYDAGRAALLQIVDMPNRRADLLMQLMIQNAYRISERKRTQFPELSDEEIALIEEAVRSAVEDTN